MFKFNQSEINHSDVYNSILIKLILQYNLEQFSLYLSFVSAILDYTENLDLQGYQINDSRSIKRKAHKPNFMINSP